MDQYRATTGSAPVRLDRDDPPDLRLHDPAILSGRRWAATLASWRTIPFPMNHAVPQPQQCTVEHQAADADDEDRCIDVWEGEARARHCDEVAEAFGVTDHLGQHD